MFTLPLHALTCWILASDPNPYYWPSTNPGDHDSLSLVSARSWSQFVGLCLFTCFLRSDHRVSLGLRFGEFPGQGSNFQPLWSHFCLVTWCSIILKNIEIITKLHLDRFNLKKSGMSCPPPHPCHIKKTATVSWVKAP